ncbi:MAG: type VI secretion system accessory protein TagJ [Pyrinomonadaceae bacterium]
MNEAKTLLAANDLDGAIQLAISHVKSKPTDMTARTFLFELLIFAGEFERAEKQLDVLGQQDVNAMIGTQIYRQCIAAERARQKVFTADAVPQFITAQPPYVGLLLDAIRDLRNGNAAQAREKLDRSENDRPANAGKINGTRDFQDFRDYNDLTASVLEVFLKGEYVWLPLENVKKIKIDKPQSLRDLCWTQATVESVDGTNGEVHLPALYVNSFKHDDKEIRLGKATDWTDATEDIFVGAGARLFWLDGQAQPLAETETLDFDRPEFVEPEQTTDEKSAD